MKLSNIAAHDKNRVALGRVGLRNGLLLNPLHDRAFDQGFMTIDRNLRVRIALCVRRDEASKRDLWRYDGTQIDAPVIHRPAPEFIEYHNDVVFRGQGNVVLLMRDDLSV